MNLLRKYPRQLLVQNNKIYNQKFMIGSIINDKFEHTNEFEQVLHETLYRYICNDPGVQSLAKYQREGYMNINDQRVQAIYGRVNDPQDILGVVLLKDGLVVEGSYERMPTHAIFTKDGLVQVSDWMFDKLPVE
jgi:hypothetical protein